MKSFEVRYITKDGKEVVLVILAKSEAHAWAISKDMRK